MNWLLENFFRSRVRKFFLWISFERYDVWNHLRSDPTIDFFFFVQCQMSDVRCSIRDFRSRSPRLQSAGLLDVRCRLGALSKCFDTLYLIFFFFFEERFLIITTVQKYSITWIDHHSKNSLTLERNLICDMQVFLDTILIYRYPVRSKLYQWRIINYMFRSSLMIWKIEYLFFFSFGYKSLTYDHFVWWSVVLFLKYFLSFILHTTWINW